MATSGAIYPICQEFETIFKATLNTEKDKITTGLGITLDDVVDQAIVIEDNENWSELCPMVQVWPLPTENTLQAEETMADNITPLWNIITTCIVQADTDEILLRNLDVYVWAMLHTMITGVTNPWHLNIGGNVIPESIFFTDVFSIKDTNKITQKGGILWTIDKEYTIT